MEVMERLAADFAAENRELARLLDTLAPADWERPTKFKNWTPNDILVHLHFWNLAADMALQDPDRFMALFGRLAQAMQQGGLRNFENGEVSERGAALLAKWKEHWNDMARRWAGVDPKTRVKWAGPDMSVRSSLTARQMETWAHGQAIFDLMGTVREEGDRIANIVVLGVNTYEWAFKVRRLPVPGAMPRVRLALPSGAMVEHGEGEGLVEGSAVEFCQVVTQTRNVADTELKLQGSTAGKWMQNAQCFAGPPETPPAPGARG